MKKLLLNIERTDDFILAIASGADVNGTYKNQPLLEYCFEQMNLEQQMHVFSKQNRTQFYEKYQILLAAGADAGMLVIHKTEQFNYLQKATAECLKPIVVLLQSKQVKKNPHYKNRFNGLYQDAAALLNQIEKEKIPQKQITKEKPQRKSRRYSESAELKAALAQAVDGTDNTNRKLSVELAFEKCMHDIYVLDSDRSLLELEHLIEANSDVAMIFEGEAHPVFNLERLLAVVANNMKLLAETMRGQGAMTAIMESPALTGNFSELQALLKELLNELVQES